MQHGYRQAIIACINYKTREDLDGLMADLLRDMSHEAEMRHCYIEAEAWEEGTEYQW